MLFIQILFLILAFSDHVHNLHTHDLCLKTQKECKGNSNPFHYQIICSYLNCHGHFKKQCGDNYCAKTTKICNDFLAYKMYKMTTVYKTYNKKKFENFLQNINVCSKALYKFNASDICINGKNCAVKKVFAHRNSPLSIIKKSSCLCSKHYSYHCGKHHCAVNKSVCDAFNLNSKIIMSYDLKDCGNGNIEIGKFL